MSIITVPPGATVLIDGQQAGTTPLDSVVLKNIAHKLAITSGQLTFEETLPPSPLSACVVYLHADPGTEGFARYAVTARNPATEVYFGEQHLGQAPFFLYLGIPKGRYRWLIGHALGTKPERFPAHAFSEYSTYPCPVELTGPAADRPPGRVETAPQLAPPMLTWLEPGRGVLDAPSIRPSLGVFAGPNGQWALFAEHGQDETIFMLRAGPDLGGTPGRPLVSWRTRELALSDGMPQDMPLWPVAWMGSKLLFLAPEPPPDGSNPGLLGLSLWECDGDSLELRRIAWWVHWSAGIHLQATWVTGDGTSAVVHTHTADAGVSAFRVIGLATGAVRVHTAKVPYDEPRLRDVAVRSPDGWSVAWSSGAIAASPGAVSVLSLRTGQELPVVETGKDEFVGQIHWSPDSRLLAVAHARRADPYFITAGDDGSTLYPARYLVVSTTGERVAEVSAGDEILSPLFAWSTGYDQAAVLAVSVVPAATPDPERSHRVYDRRIYAGPLGDPLLLLWDLEARGESGEGAWCEWLGFLEDGRPAFSLYTADGRLVSRVMEGEAGAPPAVELEGYRPKGAWSGWVGAMTSPAQASGLLLEATEGGLYLLWPDGQLFELASPAGGRLAVTYWDGKYFVAGKYVFVIERRGQ